MTEYGITSTISDETLVRYLDGQASVAERAAVDALSPHDTAGERLSELREASAAFRAVVRDIKVPPTPPLARPARGFELKAAAVTLLLFTGVATAMPPARAAVVRGVQVAAAWVAGAPTVEAEDLEPQSGRASVGFAVAGPEFVVEIDHAQMGGTLTVRRGDGANLLAEARDAELLVLPGRLRIRNAGASRADVTITLPPAVERLDVRVGGERHILRLPDRSPPIVMALTPPGG